MLFTPCLTYVFTPSFFSRAINYNKSESGESGEPGDYGDGVKGNIQKNPVLWRGGKMGKTEYPPNGLCVGFPAKRETEKSEIDR